MVSDQFIFVTCHVCTVCQAESIEEREDLLREIEYAKQQTSRSEAKRTDMITARAQELKEQVLEKQRQAALARQQYERELEEQRFD